MLVRFRWFLLGVVATIGGGAVAVGRLVRLRERLTVPNLGRVAGHAAADLLDRMAGAAGGGARQP